MSYYGLCHEISTRRWCEAVARRKQIQNKSAFPITLVTLYMNLDFLQFVYGLKIYISQNRTDRLVKCVLGQLTLPVQKSQEYNSYSVLNSGWECSPSLRLKSTKNPGGRLSFCLHWYSWRSWIEYWPQHQKWEQVGKKTPFLLPCLFTWDGPRMNGPDLGCVFVYRSSD